MEEKQKQWLHEEITNATVKIWLGESFKGTGFFISPDGYVLTAYHCIGPYPPEIWVETRFDGKYLAQLEEDKSLKAPRYDIAVLRIFNHQPSHYVPLGFVERENITDRIVAIGYPENLFRLYEGKIEGVDGVTLASDVIKGEGQSGGLVYHYRTRRVVGLASAIWKREVIINEGLAVRFGALFVKWGELRKINHKVATEWDRRLKPLNLRQLREKLVLTVLMFILGIILFHGVYSKIKVPVVSPPTLPCVPVPCILAPCVTVTTPVEKEITNNKQLGDKFEAIPATTFQDELKSGGTGPKMVWIPSGKFQMGDLGNSGEKDERPVHEVEVEKFAMGVYEITKREFQQFVEVTSYKTEAETNGGCFAGMGRDWNNAGFLQEETHPVVNISWNDAVSYTNWLTEQTKHTYRLPTEAEWEYAARAGNRSDWYFSNDENQLKDYAWYRGNSEERTHPVGQKRSNNFGLYDVIGNVWEWTCSEYIDTYNGKEKECTDKNKPNIMHVVRGGSWNSYPMRLRSSFRGNSNKCHNGLGFRVIASP